MKILTMLAVAGTTFAAACSTAPSRNAALEDARAAYRSASSDPQVVQSAPVELAYTEENLRRADAAWQDGADPALVDHLAYLARQQASIANERAKLAQAQHTIETADAERNRVLLESRTRALAQESAAHRQALQEQQQKLALAQRRALAAEGVAGAQAERNAQLESDLQQLSARMTPIGMVLPLDDVLFAVGEARLESGARRSLDRMAAFLKKYPERNVRVEGFTDATGSSAANQELSRQRSAVVRDELLRRGVDADRVDAVGYGSAFPIATNATAAGRQLNRRVDIVLSDEAGNIAGR